MISLKLSHEVLKLLEVC